MLIRLVVSQCGYAVPRRRDRRCFGVFVCCSLRITWAVPSLPPQVVPARWMKPIKSSRSKSLSSQVSRGPSPSARWPRVCVYLSLSLFVYVRVCLCLCLHVSVCVSMCLPVSAYISPCLSLSITWSVSQDVSHLIVCAPFLFFCVSSLSVLVMIPVLRRNFLQFRFAVPRVQGRIRQLAAVGTPRHYHPHDAAVALNGCICDEVPALSRPASLG